MSVIREQAFMAQYTLAWMVEKTAPPSEHPS